MKILLIGSSFLWVGMVLAISFMEAPLKFTAPGITTQLGLSIGKIVFQTLNKIEIVLSIMVLTSLFLLKEKLLTTNLLFIIPIVILAIQTFWLLPVLNIRVDAILENKSVPNTNHHLSFIVLEMIKVGTLLAAGIRYLKNNLK